MKKLKKLSIVKTFKIDCSKVKTVEDVAAIFKSMDLTFWIRTEEIPEVFQDMIDKGLANEVSEKREYVRKNEPKK